jgi:hypothetical protein
MLQNHSNTHDYTCNHLIRQEHFPFWSSLYYLAQTLELFEICSITL